MQELQSSEISIANNVVYYYPTKRLRIVELCKLDEGL